MDNIDKATETFVEKTTTFMADKKMWVFWVLYTVMSGALFSVLFGIVRLTMQRWWIAPIIIIGIGLMWGTTKYSAMKSTLRSENTA